MTTDEALQTADSYTRGMTFFEGQTGVGVALAQLAADVRRLNAMVVYDCREPGVCPDVERLRSALEKCKEWAEAYPIEIFPEPTPEQVDAVCQTLGFRLDRISAMVLRDYTGRIGEIAREALAESV